MRDNALAKQLCAMGHDAILLPLYLPLTLDESAASPNAPVFFGGLNVYLQQKFSWFRHAPRWLDRWLDHPVILKWLGRFSGMTQGADTGQITLSMLQGEQGAQNRELDKLIEWIRQIDRPDVIWLSTGLLAGVARRIRRETGVPVFASLQGEDSFFRRVAGAMEHALLEGDGSAALGVGWGHSAQSFFWRVDGTAPWSGCWRC